MNRPIVRNKRFNFKRIDKTTDMGHELVKPKQLKMRRKWFKNFARCMITRGMA